MSCEREIFKRLLEGVEPDYAPDVEKDEDLEEASFEANGKIFKAAFGHYSCDGEPISREDYFAAKEGGNVSTGNAKGAEEPKTPKASPYESYKPEDFDSSLDSFENEIEDLVNDMRDIHPMDRDDQLDRLDQMSDVLTDMEDYLTDEQYERADDLQTMIRRAKDTDYDGPSVPEYDDPYLSRGLKQSDFY